MSHYPGLEKTVELVRAGFTNCDGLSPIDSGRLLALVESVDELHEDCGHSHEKAVSMIKETLAPADKLYTLVLETYYTKGQSEILNP